MASKKLEPDADSYDAVTGGHAGNGGDRRAVQEQLAPEVQRIFSTFYAFAASGDPLAAARAKCG